MERFNLKNLNDVEGKEQFRVEVSNRIAALEDLDTKVEINSAWETIRENITISAKESLGYFELKKHKPWFDEGCSELLDQRKRAKFQWWPSYIPGHCVPFPSPLTTRRDYGGGIPTRLRTEIVV
jgi:hypothetical protein